MLSQLSIDMMIKDEEENNVDYDSYNPNFRYYCKNLVKVSNRNRIIKEQLRIDQSLRQSISAENFESIIERKIITERKRRRMTPGPSLLNPAERRVFLDINSCFMWYILKSKGCRNIIPDYELTYCREVLKNTIKKIPKGETYFGLGKLYFHDESYQESLYHFTEALKYSNDLLFKSWYSFLILKCGSSNREQASLVLSRLKGKI
jgi:tetratricopeptide (TPR) repeat protein